MTWQLYHAGSTKAKGSSGVHSSQSNHERDELWEAKIEKNSSTLFTTETRSTRMHGEPVELRIADCGLRIADFLPLHLHHKDTKMTKRHHVESSWLRVFVVRFFWLRLGCSVFICGSFFWLRLWGAREFLANSAFRLHYARAG